MYNLAWSSNYGVFTGSVCLGTMCGLSFRCARPWCMCLIAESSFPDCQARPPIAHALVSAFGLVPGCTPVWGMCPGLFPGVGACSRAAPGCGACSRVVPGCWGPVPGYSWVLGHVPGLFPGFWACSRVVPDLFPGVGACSRVVPDLFPGFGVCSRVVPGLFPVFGPVPGLCPGCRPVPRLFLGYARARGCSGVRGGCSRARSVFPHSFIGCGKFSCSDEGMFRV